MPLPRPHLVKMPAPVWMLTPDGTAHAIPWAGLHAAVAASKPGEPGPVATMCQLEYAQADVSTAGPDADPCATCFLEYERAFGPRLSVAVAIEPGPSHGWTASGP